MYYIIYTKNYHIPIFSPLPIISYTLVIKQNIVIFVRQHVLLVWWGLRVLPSTAISQVSFALRRCH